MSMSWTHSTSSPSKRPRPYRVKLRLAQTAAQALILLFLLRCGLDSASGAEIASPAVSNEIHQLLRQSPLIDGHNDLPWQFRKRKLDLDGLDLTQDTSRLKNPLVTDI